MASYLRPRRGKKATAESQAVVLKKGEVFFEIDASGISTGSAAKACGKIKMGDGSTTYSNLGYFIDVDTSVVAFTDTITASSSEQGEDYYALLNAVAPSATVKSIFGNIKSLLFKMATNLTQIKRDTPFAFGVDANNNYGYIKAGADTVTPFKTDPSGDIYLGEYSNNGNYSKSVSGYATCSFKVSAGLKETTLWTNDSPSSSFASSTPITLNQSINGFTFIGIIWRRWDSDPSTTIETIVRPAELLRKFSKDPYRVATYQSSTGGDHNENTYYRFRMVYASSETVIRISTSYRGSIETGGKFFSTNGTNPKDNIPQKVIGYKVG